MTDSVTLINASLEPVVYRIRSSIINLFSISSFEGILQPDSKVVVQIRLKAFPSDNFLKSQPDPICFVLFYVDCMECDDSYQTMGSKAFWDAYAATCISKIVNGKAIKSVLNNQAPVTAQSSTPVRKDSTTIEAPHLPRKEGFLNASPSLSKLDSFKELKAAELVELLPLCLKFIGKLVLLQSASRHI